MRNPLESVVRRTGCRMHAPLAALIAVCGVSAHAQITPGTRAPTVSEQQSFELINRFRADPQGELSRMLGVSQATLSSSITPSTSAAGADGTAWSANFWQNLAPGNPAASAMDFFHVKPGNLLFQWSQLAGTNTLHPFAWNGNLGQSSLGYANLVVADAGTSASPHAVPPYANFSFQRFTDAGYVNAATVGENIAANFPNNTAYQHAGFAVDWGNTANGIQSPPGHRNSMLSASFTELGIGMAAGWTAGNVTQVQHFGDRFDSAAEYVWGYAWQDPALGSYTYGEGLTGLTVQIVNAGNSVLGSTTTDANGGYTLDVAALANGNYTVRFLQGANLLGSQAVNIGNLGLYKASFVTTPVPEPATWATLLAGGALLALRRRRSLRTLAR
ncbi:PEP-CTERM sorting domain-containing protein [Ideonella sp. A 288]|uniref:CAP domain-containing protein n=1 Tax=Ideonella sp. A 288 TaxID=1962181 RepID=UPI0011866792|nr:PEP-CTERM sorting domain-containing protein [Ideonella sp. A 288]